MADSDEEEEETEEDRQAKLLALLPRTIVRKCEMPDDLFVKLQVICKDALGKHKLQKDIAREIKHTLDTTPDFNELVGKGPWQVIAGTSFASAVTFEAMHIAFFDIPKYQLTLLIYKSMGVQNL
eukprot:CAMPEP_0172712668 /NCGR_PEP_ID=MMETSP1074-20121228/61233_1 /TAXON_ID=2916 /ORGANISM="Ceratium fusus, Strain PA161109" /LENGTH=123 /DNA_ID=CAMNT_0013536627 /DNA_START=74 /DNA_END=445 /DNA_ORIENTATION=+